MNKTTRHFSFKVNSALLQKFGILPILILISILFSILSENFLTSNNLMNVLRQASINIVLATGMTIVILTGGIDLSVGSILGLHGGNRVVDITKSVFTVGNDNCTSWGRSSNGIYQWVVNRLCRSSSFHCNLRKYDNPARSSISIA